MSDDTKPRVTVEELPQNLEELDPELAEGVQGGRSIVAAAPRSDDPDIIVGSGPGAPGGHTRRSSGR